MLLLLLRLLLLLLLSPPLPLISISASDPPPRCAPTAQGRELAIVDISKATSVIAEDVIDTMTRLGMLKYVDGDHQIIATPVCTFFCIFCSTKYHC